MADYVPQYLIITVLGIALCQPLAGQTEDQPPEEPVSELEEWRATLLFGINQELGELIPSLAEQKVTELSDEVVGVFERSVVTKVRIACLDYLSAIESEAGQSHAIALLADYDLLDNELVDRLMRYLAESDFEPTRDELETIRGIATQGTFPLMAASAIRLLAKTGEDPDFFTDLYEQNDDNEQVRGEILLALGEIGDAKSYDFVVSLLDPDSTATTTLERYAIDTLGKIGDERAIPEIIRQMDSQNATTRAYAVSALRHFTGNEVDTALNAALRDDFWRVRVAALEAIGERGLEGSVPVLTYKMRRDPEEKVRIAAVNALVAVDTTEAWEALRTRVSNTRTPETERVAVLDQLAQHDPSSAVPIIEAIVTREWDRERSTLLDSVGKIVSIHPSAAFLPIYERLLGHKNFIIQIYAIRGAGRSELISLKPEIERRAEEGNNRAVQSAALRALDSF